MVVARPDRSQLRPPECPLPCKRTITTDHLLAIGTSRPGERRTLSALRVRPASDAIGTSGSVVHRASEGGIARYGPVVAPSRLRLGVASAALLTLFACSSTSGSARRAAVALVAQAHSTLLAVGTARVEESDTIYDPGQQPHDFGQTGELSLVTGDARLRSLPGPDAGYKTMVIVNGRGYVSPPQIPSPGRSWTLLVGRSAPGSFGFSCTTPVSWLAELERQPDLRIAGAEQVRGILTNRLTATIENQAGNALPGLNRIPITIWIDQRQRLRMFTMDAWDGDSRHIGIKISCWYYDFAVPAHVTAPPSSRVDTFPTRSPAP